MKKQEVKTSKIKIVWLFVKYKILLPINTLLCSNKLILRLLLYTKFKKSLKKLQVNNIENKYFISDKEVINSIIQVYFSTKKKVFIKDYITGMFMVPEASYKMIKSQPRNSLCNCGSGKKFKKCCLLKYR